MTNRPAPFRRSDLIPAFEAAKAAGYQQVSVTMETPDGRRFHITAGNAPAADRSDMTPLEKWKAGRGAS